MTPLTVATVESLRRYLTDDDDMSLFHDDVVVALCDYWLEQHPTLAAENARLHAQLEAAQIILNGDRDGYAAWQRAEAECAAAYERCAKICDDVGFGFAGQAAVAIRALATRAAK